MSTRLHLLGVRHHGPGSAASVVRALDQLDPSEVLIEGPPEGAALVRYAHRGLTPPVALLVYAKDEPSQAVFYPYAAWSPEWQAIRWAVQRGRPVVLIDRPVGSRLREDLDKRKAIEALLATDPRSAPEDAEEDEAPEAPDEDEAVSTDGAIDAGDPLSRLADLAGYSDGEAWWNALIEESPGDIEVFLAIEAAIEALRQDAPVRPSDEVREAFMRAAIEAALTRTTGPIVAVVGAWHTPALRGGVRPDDKARIKAASKTLAVEATWVPWTDGRLAFTSGYGAGVTAPGWYRALWEARDRPSTSLTVQWQTRVARALRANGRGAAPSLVIDAVRLTEALCAIRGLARPGLDEMRDASLATLCAGEDVPWRIVERALLRGDGIGSVPEDVPSTPLAADLARQQRALKLKPEASAREVSLDLRSENGGAKSRLLHQLLLLEVPWGRLTDAGSSRGTFRENWILEWEPELSVKLVEALRWGTTIQGAANARVSDRLAREHALDALAESVRGALLAGLDAAAQRGIRRIDEMAAGGADTATLCVAIPPLVDVSRYGTARELSLEGLDALVRGLVDKVLIGLRHATRHLDADAARGLREALDQLDRALPLIEDGARLGGWDRALTEVAEDEDSAPLVAGFAVRRLHDRAAWPPERVARALGSRLSPGVALADAAAWLEGFLAQAAEVLLHDDKLLGLVDTWLGGLTDEALLEALPLMRRATASFGTAERRRLLRTVAGEQRHAELAAATRTTAAWEEGLPLLATILGLEAP